MGLLDRLLGREHAAEPQRPASRRGYETDDERAVERYRYLVRTAPPGRIEEAHREAFEKLTPDQRQLALQELSRGAPEGERPTSDDPQSLARAATRAELREPGSVERAFGRGGLGGAGVPLLPIFATAFIGTLAAQALFGDYGDGGSGDGGSDQSGSDQGDTGDGGTGEAAGGDAAGGDYGGGDWSGGGDLGGGDFGGM